jgi:hypothetical protein
MIETIEWEDYEKEAKKGRDKNMEIMQLFRQCLQSNGLKEITIRKHVSNASFYINEYLLYEDVVSAAEGIDKVNEFFDWFFPRKALWSSVNSTKETVSSLKKFYKCLTGLGLIKEDDYGFFFFRK